MYELKIISDFAAAHNLRNFRGKCENLHGHNWKIEVIVRGNQLDASGVVMDFGDLKRYTRECLAEIDHKYLNELDFFKENNPSSENIARFLYEWLTDKLKGEPCWVHKVLAWESKDACAAYVAEANG